MDFIYRLFFVAMCIFFVSTVTLSLIFVAILLKDASKAYRFLSAALMPNVFIFIVSVFCFLVLRREGK